MAEPWLKTINPPNSTKTNKIGSSQYFFLTFKNSKNSIKKLIIKIDSSSCFLLMIFQPSKIFFYFFLNPIYLYQTFSLLETLVLLQ